MKADCILPTCSYKLYPVPCAQHEILSWTLIQTLIAETWLNELSMYGALQMEIYMLALDMTMTVVAIEKKMTILI